VLYMKIGIIGAMEEEIQLLEENINIQGGKS
jgi:nucleoside phosphorylase